jgi:hypothetical protein
MSDTAAPTVGSAATCSAVFFGFLWHLEFASDGKWETTEPKGHVRRHIICVDRVTSTDGIAVWCVVIGRRKISWARIQQNATLSHEEGGKEQL